MVSFCSCLDFLDKIHEEWKRAVERGGLGSSLISDRNNWKLFFFLILFQGLDGQVIVLLLIL